MRNQPLLAIIGCGWLGRHIIASLKYSFSFIATTAHQHSAAKLPIPAYVYDWQLHWLPSPLRQADIYLIAIPPATGARNHYSENMARLARQLPFSALTIMISSTSVYPKIPGLYTESTPPDKHSIIFQAEQNLRNIHPRANILRCGGLFGDGRLSGQTYYGKENPLPNKRLNLIPYRDIANAVMALAISHYNNKCYNLVHPQQPKRHEFYQAQAKLRQQPIPEFSNHFLEDERLINGRLIESELNFTYQYPPTQSL